jgi:hypothetical protein
MSYVAAIIVTLLLIVLLAGLAFAPVWLQRERPQGPVRENYGPPPGAHRALGHEELDDRGWPEFPLEYNATTASAISHMIERSA